MNSIRIAGFFLLVQLVAGRAPLLSAEEPAGASLTVKGKASLVVESQYVRGRLVIGDKGPDVVAVSERIWAKEQEVEALLVANGVAREEIAREELVMQKLDPSRPCKLDEDCTPYRGNLGLTFKLRDLARYEALVWSLQGCAAARLDGLFFESQDGRRARRQVAVDALRNAREKAADLAGEAGLALGRTIRIVDLSGRTISGESDTLTSSNRAILSPSTQQTIGGNLPPPAVPQAIVVTSELDVTWEMLPGGR